MTSALNTPLTVTTTTTTTPAIANTTRFLLTDKRCTYPSKPCSNPRAVKQDKTLHRLCELHRRRANLNQQRMQQRRRLLRRHQPQDESDPSASFRHSIGSVRVDSTTAFAFGSPISFHDHAFSPDELHVLERLLFDSGEDFDDADASIDINGDLNFHLDFECNFDAAADWRFSC